MGLIEQVEEGGTRRRTLEIQAQRSVEHLPVPLGERLKITGAAAVAQDPQRRQQQQEPFRVAHPAAVAAIGNGPDDADQVISSGLIVSSRAGCAIGMEKSR